MMSRPSPSLLGPDGITSEGEGRDIIAMLAELPDLWDVNVSAWENDSATARFAEEGYQEPYIEFVKSLTSKPVVGVGRYTSPDHMAALVRKIGRASCRESVKVQVGAVA